MQVEKSLSFSQASFLVKEKGFPKRRKPFQNLCLLAYFPVFSVTYSFNAG